MLKLKLQYFGHLVRRTDSLEKTLMLGKIEVSRRRGRWRMRWLNGITNSMDMSLSMDRGTWHSVVHGVTKGRTRLKRLSSSSNSNSSATWLCPTLCDPMNRSTPGLPVHHQLPEFTPTLHWVGDAIQPSHPLSSPSPPAFNLSQYQGLFQWVSSLHQVAKILEFQLQHQSFQWIFKIDFL